MNRAPANLQQLLAASALVVSCENICRAGLLPIEDEQKLRVLILKACKAFEITPLAERGGEVVKFPSAEGYSA